MTDGAAKSIEVHVLCLDLNNNNNNNNFIWVSVYFSTAVLIGDTVNKETNIVNEQKLVKNPNW